MIVNSIKLAPWRNLFFKDFCTTNQNGSVAQLYSASDFGSEGWGLESLRGHEQDSSEMVGLLFLVGLCSAMIS